MKTITKTYDRIVCRLKDNNPPGGTYVPHGTMCSKLFPIEGLKQGCVVTHDPVMGTVISGFDHAATLRVIVGCRAADLSPTRVIVKVNATNAGYSEGANGSPIVAEIDVNPGDTVSIAADGIGADVNLSGDPSHSYLNIREVD